MEMGVSSEGTRTVIAVEGRLNTNTAPKLEALARDLHGKGSVDLVVDLAGCDYVSSAGLRAIVAMHKRAIVKGSLAFRNVAPDVMAMFRETGFADVLVLE